MTLEEKRNIIKEELEKNFLYISPRAIQGGAKLISNLETLELYEKMAENTKKFTENLIVNLTSTIEHNKELKQELLRFNFVFCGDFDDLPDNLGNPSEFILNNKDKIIAIHKYINGTERRNFFVGFEQYETINHYSYTFIKLDQMLQMLEENNIEFKIDETIDKNTPSCYRDDKETKVFISYNPIKEEQQNGPKLIKRRKENM